METPMLTTISGRHMVPVLNAIGTDCACVGVSTHLGHRQRRVGILLTG